MSENPKTDIKTDTAAEVTSKAADEQTKAAEDTKTAVEAGIPKGVKTEKVAFVTFKGRLSSVSHHGVKATPYFFQKNVPTRIDDVDQGNYKKKAERNPQNWEVTYKSLPVYREAHMMKFNGNKQYPAEITLAFDNKETGEKDVKILFRVGEWVEITDPLIAKQLSDKALANEAWSYQLDKVMVKL